MTTGLGDMGTAAKYLRMSTESGVASGVSPDNKTELKCIVEAPWKMPHENTGNTRTVSLVHHP